MAVAGMTPDGMPRSLRGMQPSPHAMPNYRPKYHGHPLVFDSVPGRETSNMSVPSPSNLDLPFNEGHPLDEGQLSSPSSLSPHHNRQPRGSAESLMGKVLEKEGLHRYLDARYLQQEIAEANDMTAEDLDRAAHALLSSDVNPNPERLPYYDHLGGYNAHDMKDYNQYSRQPDMLAQSQAYSDGHPQDPDDPMVYVTTL